MKEAAVEGTRKRAGGGAKLPAQFLVKCKDSRCSAKAGPLEDKKRCHLMALEHALSFKHVVDIYRTRVCKTINPADMPRMA